MNNTSGNIALNTTKAIILTFAIYFIVDVILISIREFGTLISLKEITLIKYIWLAPVELNSYIENLNISLTENFLFIIYLLVACLVISAAIVTTVLSKIIELIRNVWNAVQIQCIFKAIQSAVCWLLAYITVNSINNKWQIEKFLDTRIFSNIDMSMLFLLLMKLTYIWGIVYFFKSIYHSLYNQMLKMPFYLNKKVWGE